MPRSPRSQPPGETFHLTARGVRRQAVFLDDLDYGLYVGLLGQTAQRHRWIVLAYCLIPNHLHLLVRLEDSTLSRGMHRQQGVYARRFNERHGLSGHVFEARFHAVHVVQEAHRLHVLRYIVQNPVRAGLCEDPADWPWSSHRAVAGLTHGGSPVFS
jgi:REP element-mobilizing transposase RayT